MSSIIKQAINELLLSCKVEDKDLEINGNVIHV